jgi:hypothetical protein
METFILILKMLVSTQHIEYFYVVVGFIFNQYNLGLSFLLAQSLSVVVTGLLRQENLVRIAVTAL